MSKVVTLAPDGTPLVSLTTCYVSDDYIHRRFENEHVSLTLRTNRYVHHAHIIPPEHWGRFSVDVENIIRDDPVDGSFLVEPKRVKDVDASKTYRTLEEAMRDFDLFVAKYTESEFDPETGELIEVGNIFTPPDPDKPTLKEDSPIKEEFGSW